MAGKGVKKCHLNFFCSLNFDIKSFSCKKSSLRKKGLGIKRHFPSNSFHISVLRRSLRKHLFKKVKCLIGGKGGQKSAKKCHVIFEWPLMKADLF